MGSRDIGRQVDARKGAGQLAGPRKKGTEALGDLDSLTEAGTQQEYWRPCPGDAESVFGNPAIILATDLTRLAS